MHIPVTLDRRGTAPLHRQIYDDLQHAVLDGRLAAGDRLPSTRDLAAALRVSRATVTTAYDQLIAEGYLDTRRGSGTFVSRELPDQPLAAVRRTDDARPARADVRLSAFGRRLPAVRSRPRARSGTIELSPALADDTLFPLASWTRLLRQHLRRMTTRAAAAADVAGHEGLRQAIAAYLGRSRAVHCRAEQVLVVSGSQQALDLCARVLVDPGDHVAVEEPGYPDAGDVFTAVGAVVRRVPVDDDGLVVARLPATARLAHVTPSHQYPSGASLSLARRLELLAWARTHRALVIEDDYDSEFRYDGAPLPSLQGLGDHTRVVYVGTFSTAMFAGLRLGYLVLPPALVEPFRRAKWYASRHTAQLEQAALADFIREGHLERHIRRMRRVYKRRRDALLDALQRHFGDRAALVGDAAGLHAVVRFARPGMAERAERCGVGLASTRDCYAGPAPANEFIVRFSGVPERVLREGVRRLAVEP